MQLILTALCFYALLISSCGHSKSSEPFLTRDIVQELKQNSSQNRIRLEPETLKGCVAVPSTDPVQRLMVGFEFTGETCFVTVSPNNFIRIDFLGDIDIPLISTSTAQVQTDTFVGELGNDQVLIVQYYQGRVIDVTQTIYDDNDIVVYGKLGKGDMIKSCHLHMSTAERAAGQKDCGRK